MPPRPATETVKVNPPSVEVASPAAVPAYTRDPTTWIEVASCPPAKPTGIFALAVVNVQAPAMGSTARITRLLPVEETATHTPLPYATDCQPLASAPVTPVQVEPLSLLRITWSKEAETATHTPLPYATDIHIAFAPMESELEGSTEVQVIPSGLVITRLLPVIPTAIHTPFPYATDAHMLSAADTRRVQVIPSGLVITRLPEPE